MPLLSTMKVVTNFGSTPKEVGTVRAAMEQQKKRTLVIEAIVPRQTTNLADMVLQDIYVKGRQRRVYVDPISRTAESYVEILYAGSEHIHWDVAV